MRPKKIIVLVIDRLRAAALGAYGAAWCDTPAFDQLASEATLFDQALVPIQTLDGLCRLYWQGGHPLAPRDDAAPTLMARLGEAGFATTLLTDEAEVAEHPLAADFGDRIRLAAPEVEEPVDDLEETQLAHFFAAAIEALTAVETHEADRPSLLWLHARGMAGPWDAPLELRNALVDEEDPPPPSDAVVPSRWLPEEFDPDEILGATQAYTGQIMALDACLAAFCDHLRQSAFAQETLFLLLGARGFPLGEHRRLGDVEELLYGEMLHVPWLLRLPDGDGRLVRTPALVQPGDLPATLYDWLELAVPAPAGSASLLPLVRGAADQIRDRLALLTHDGRRALRTAHWHALFTPDAPPELYVKPDDRWEYNEIADRIPAVAAALEQAAAEFAAAARSGTLDQLAPLDV